jgi:uroporphyrin-3 C-methyltransferase
MNESLSSPIPNPQPIPASSGTESASVNPVAHNTGGAQPNPAVGLLRRVTYAGLSVLALLLLAQWWTARTEQSALRMEVAQRLHSGDTTNTETKLIVKSVQEGIKEMQAKVTVLESRQSEAQSQQLALEQLYQDLSKNRDDWALAEIEQVLSTASQQLQLAGNVQGALIALQNADRGLSRSDKPQFITIRRALARDQDKLKALPNLDLTGMALRLDSIIGQIDGMPLLSDEKPSLPATQPKNARTKNSARTLATTGKDTAGTDWLAVLDDKWQSWINEMWTEVRQLIRVRSVETPDALLLAPGQAYYARENLKLRLLNARLALLSRNESAFRSDMIAAQDAITKYFDTRARQTQVAQALLKQVQGSNLSIEMPNLADSLNAVRKYKAK